MRKRRVSIGILTTLGLTVGSVGADDSFFKRQAAAQERRSQDSALLPNEKTVGKLERVTAFTGSLPTGVTVSQNGRILVDFPRWGDPVPLRVAEIKDRKPVAYPDADINRLDTENAAETFVSE